MASCGSEYTDGCVKVVKEMKTVQVPCTRNKCNQYTVKIPRQVTHQVPRTVNYTDYESRSKQVPYTVNRQEKRTRMETQKYQVPVNVTETRMVPVTKKVPKTICVDVTTQVPQTYTTTHYQTRERQVAFPYYVNVPETKYRTVTEQVPVQKSKVVMDTFTKTVYDTKQKTRCIPVTKTVTKRIPVYNVVAKPAPPCPPTDPEVDGVQANFARIDKNGDGQLNYNEEAFDIADVNKDSQLSSGEYRSPHVAENVGNVAGLIVRLFLNPL